MNKSALKRQWCLLSGSLPPLQFGARDQDRKFLLRNGGGTNKGGHGRPKRREEKSEEKRSQKRREVRREEKSDEKIRLEPKMSDDHSDSEGNVGHEADFVDMTGDMEVELHLPLEVDMEQDRPHEDIRIYLGPLPRMRLISFRRSSVDSSHRTGPDINGPDTDCPFRSLRNPVVW